MGCPRSPRYVQGDVSIYFGRFLVVFTVSVWDRSSPVYRTEVVDRSGQSPMTQEAQSQRQPHARLLMHIYIYTHTYTYIQTSIFE